MYAIENDAFVSKFYSGTIAGLSLKSVIPLSYGVDPHGMAIDPIDGAVVVCSQDADPLMVAVAPYPYNLWANITGDHGVSEGINAVAIL